MKNENVNRINKDTESEINETVDDSEEEIKPQPLMNRKSGQKAEIDKDCDGHTVPINPLLDTNYSKICLENVIFYVAPIDAPVQFG